MRHLLVALVAFAFVAPLSACSDATGPNVSLELANARWAKGAPGIYQYVYDQSCECLVTGPILLHVEHGVVTAVAALPGTSFAGDALPEPSSFPSIDDLFDRLRADAAADPVQFDVEYDGKYGFPRRASVDVRSEIADDEYTFEITDFNVLEPLTAEGDLGEAAALWDERGPDDYSFVHSLSCFCGMVGPVHLTVRNDEVVAVEPRPGFSAPTGTPLDPDSFPTIDDLFDRLLADAAQNPVRFDLTFDAELGYPTSATVDISQMIADEEYAFIVTEFAAQSSGKAS